MDSRKVYLGFIIVLVLLGGLFVFSAKEANTLLAKQSNKLVGLKAQDQAELNQQTQLYEEKGEVKKYSELNTIAQSVVPQDKNQAEAVREIVNLATQSGISKLDSISFPESNLGIGKSNSVTQVTPVKAIPGVDVLQITVTQSSSDLVPYSSFITFLSKLEQNRRTAQVSSINITPAQGNNGQISFTLVINEFVRP